MAEEKYRFEVEGSIYDKFNHFHGHYKRETIAPTEAKAKSNVMAQIKKEKHKAMTAYFAWKNVSVKRI